LRLLDEGVKGDEFAFMDTNHHARNSPAPERHSEFEQAATERATERHSDRPSKLEIFQAGSDDPSVRPR
jgi:hypothetical protein